MKMTLTIDFSAWAQISVTGGDRVRFIGGLSTVPVATMAVGQSHWGAILSPKGRVLSVLELTVETDALRLRCQPSLADKTLALLERYAVMDDVAFALDFVAGFRRWSAATDPWTARFEAGTPPADALALDAPAVQAARIRAGLPHYGTDIDEDCFPFESALGHALDYQKGCYVGQEPVFRVFAQGNAARAARVVRLGEAKALPAGTLISHPKRDKAGEITSSIVYEGETWALAYMHRSVLDENLGFAIAGHAVTLALPAVP